MTGIGWGWMSGTSLGVHLNVIEQTLRLLVDAIPDMFWSATPDGSRDFVNKRWLEYTGLTLAQGLNEGFDVIHSEDRAPFLRQWESALSTGSSLKLEMRLRCADGEYRWFLHRIVPMRDSPDRIARWFAVATDIEDTRRADEVLREHARQLKQILDVVPLHMFIWEAD